MKNRNLVAWLAAMSCSVSIVFAQAPAVVERPAAVPVPAPVPATAKAPAADVRDISDALKTIIEKHGVPGMVAAVTTIDRTVMIGAAGKRVSSAEVPVGVTDQFHIGSCTKSMSATLVAMMVQEGTLKWSMTVADAFPEFAGSMDEGWKSVTLEHLLVNRSGTPSDLSKDGLWNTLWTHKGTPSEQRLTLVEGLVKNPPAAKPNEKYIYSNAAFAMAGAIAERAAKKPWEELIRERLFAPLGMDSAGFGAPGVGSAEADNAAGPAMPDQPWGHTPDGKPMPPGPEGTAGVGGQRSRGSDNPGAIGPAGTVRCNVEDWAKYIRLHLRGEALMRTKADAGKDTLGLTHSTFTKLHSPYLPGAEPAYGMGWMLTERPWAKGSRDGDTGRVLTHGGSNNMWFCVAWLAPERDLAILVMCNRGGVGGKACDEAAGKLIELYIQSLQTK